MAPLSERTLPRQDHTARTISAVRLSGPEEIEMARTKIAGLLLGVLTVASASCQTKPAFAPVEGTVTKEGKPLAGVIVDFYPDPGTRGPRSTSTLTDEAGHYRLRSSWGGDDGAVVGPHRVCILNGGNEGRNSPGRLSKETMNTKEIQEKVKQLKSEESSSPRVHLRYGSPNETPLQVEVQPGAQVIDLEVK
jgi:hypothetical protein